MGDEILSYGKLEGASWTEAYTAPNGGVSLEYSHGSHCSNGGAQHQTTLILECDRNTEYALVDFNDMCHSFATIRSKHACPIGHVHQESDDDKVTGTDIGIIVGTIGGAMLIGAVIIFIIVVVLVVIKKVKRSNSPSSVYSDMIG